MVQVRPGVKKEVVVHEINIMNQLHHEKLLALHEAFDLGSQMCLIEEMLVFTSNFFLYLDDTNSEGAHS